jgi:hypothetical protein
VYLSYLLPGILPLLYALLLHNGAPRYSSASPLKLVQSTIDIATWGVRLLNRISQLDLQTVQNCIGSEGNSLEFQHVMGYILWYCSKHTCEALLHEAIEIVGYFSVNNPSGQVCRYSRKISWNLVSVPEFWATECNNVTFYP